MGKAVLAAVIVCPTPNPHGPLSQFGARLVPWKLGLGQAEMMIVHHFLMSVAVVVVAEVLVVLVVAVK